jgi:hypothetical protein
MPKQPFRPCFLLLKQQKLYSNLLSRPRERLTQESRWFSLYIPNHLSGFSRKHFLGSSFVSGGRKKLKHLHNPEEWYVLSPSYQCIFPRGTTLCSVKPKQAITRLQSFPPKITLDWPRRWNLPTAFHCLLLFIPDFLFLRVRQIILCSHNVFFACLLIYRALSCTRRERVILKRWVMTIIRQGIVYSFGCIPIFGYSPTAHPADEKSRNAGTLLSSLDGWQSCSTSDMWNLLSTAKKGHNDFRPAQRMPLFMR